MTETMQINVNNSGQGKGSSKRPARSGLYNDYGLHLPLAFSNRYPLLWEWATLIVKFLYKHILDYVRHIWSKAL